MKVIDVKALPKYNIAVSFEDGVSGVINLADLVKQGIFRGIKDEVLFSKVYTTGYSIAWSEELEIDALAIYCKIIFKIDVNSL